MATRTKRKFRSVRNNHEDETDFEAIPGPKPITTTSHSADLLYNENSKRKYFSKSKNASNPSSPSTTSDYLRINGLLSHKRNPSQSVMVRLKRLDTLRLNQRIKVKDFGFGIIQFLGCVHFAQGLFVGVELDEPNGKHDGSYHGKRYFTTKDKHGVLVKQHRVELLDININTTNDINDINMNDDINFNDIINDINMNNDDDNNKQEQEQNNNNNNNNNNIYNERLKLIEISKLEEKQFEIYRSKLLYESRMLLDKINSTIHTFDLAVSELREEKYKLQNDLKLTDLKFLTLLSELLVLSNFEDREIELNGKLLSCRTEKAQVVVDLTETQEKLSSKLEEIRLWQEKDKKIMKEFDSIVGERNQFYDELKKIFKRKIKRHKKKIDSDSKSDYSESESESDSSESESESDSSESESESESDNNNNNNNNGVGGDNNSDNNNDSCPKDCDN
eukprot:541776_1